MKKLFIIVAALAPFLSNAQLDRSVRPDAGPAPQINIKDSEVFKTDNGITVILSENHKLPRVSFELVMGSSPMSEGNMAGLADITGSLITSGTTNRTKDELDAEVDYMGASLRADNNSIRLSCLTKHMDKGLEIMSDVLLNANFPESEVERVIKQNESGLLSAKSDPGTMASNAVSKVNFQNHPYGEIMTESSLANIKREIIQAYYKQMFTPSGSYLVVVGDINLDETKKAVEKFFSNWAGGYHYTTELNSPNTNSGSNVYFVPKPGAVQSVIQVTFPIDIKQGHPDYLKLKVFNSVLGAGGFGSRLMQNLREDKAYTYGCYSRLNVTSDGSWVSAGGNFRNAVTDSAIVEILKEIEGMVTAKVTQDELDLMKSSMAGSFARSLEQPSTIARFALSIIRNELPADYYQTYLKKLAAITLDDLLEVGKKYYTADRCNIVVVGNEEVLPKLKQFDSDGKIQKLDAFGDPIKERTPADISADELLDAYVAAVVPGLSGKKLAKKFKKIKSMKEVYEFNMSQMPFPLMSTRVWVSPNSSASKMEANGMMIQKEYFDGNNGASFNMQTGSEALSEDEIAAKKKSVGIIPEMNYSDSGIKYELIGIEEIKGRPCYVLKVEDGSSETYDYFDKETKYKVQTTTIQSTDGETQETTAVYSGYKEYNGIMFPENIQFSAGPVSFDGTCKSREFNVKVDLDSYK